MYIKIAAFRRKAQMLHPKRNARVTLLIIFALVALTASFQATLERSARASTAISGLVAANGFNKSTGTTSTDSPRNKNTGTLPGGARRTAAGTYVNVVYVTNRTVHFPESPGWKVSGATTYSVNQAGNCSFTLSATSANVAIYGGIGTVNVTPSAFNCAWTAVSNVNWVTIFLGSSGTGNGTIYYSVGANNGAARSGTLTIAGQTYTVNQAGTAGACTYTLSAPSANVPSTSSNGSVNVIASATTCTWTAASNVSWVTLTAGFNGVGNGTVSYSVAANTGAARSGTLTIAGQTYTINQAAGGGGCSYSLSATSTNVAIYGGTGTVNVLPSVANCAWTAVSNVNWVTIFLGSSGTGNGTVYYSVGANNGAARSGTLTIAGQTYTVNQAGTAGACTYTLSAPSANVPSTSSNGSVNVVASATTCSWTAASNVSWVTITGGFNGAGNGTVSYSLAANTGAARSGTLTIAGQTYTVNQAVGATTCTYSLSTTSANVAASVNNGSVNVIPAASNCAWTAMSNVAWVTITSGANGTGNGTVNYSVAANTGAARSGTLTVAGQTYTINQAAGGGGCSYSLSATSANVVIYGGTGTVNVIPSAFNCAWTAVSNVNWVTILVGRSGTGNGTVLYLVAAHYGTPRTGTLTIAGQTFTVYQPLPPPPAANTADPTLLPIAAAQAPPTTAPTVAGGESYLDPVSGVRVWRATSETYPCAGNTGLRVHDYADTNQISHEWGDGYQTILIRTCGEYHLVDFKRGVGFTNWRKFASGSHPDSDLSFVFSNNTATPRIAYSISNGNLIRYNTATNQIENTGNFPKTAWGARGWLQNDLTDTWFVANSAAQTSCKAWNGQTNESREKTIPLYDECRLENRGRYVQLNTGQGGDSVWDLQTDLVRSFNPPTGHSFHIASPTGYFTSVDVDSGGGRSPYYRMDPATGTGTLIYDNAQYGYDYSGFHHSGNWVNQAVADERQWFLISTYGSTQGAFLKRAIGFMRLDGSDIRFLAHSYNEIVDYWQIPRAMLAPNGKLVVFDSEFRRPSGGGDVYVVEVPLR